MTSKEEVNLIDLMIENIRNELRQAVKGKQQLLKELDELYDEKVAMINNRPVHLVARKGGVNEFAV